MGELWRMKLVLNHHRIDQIRGWKMSDSAFLVKWLVTVPERAGGVQLDAPPVLPIMKEVKGGIPTEADKAEHRKAIDAYKVALDEYNRTGRIVETPVLALKQTQIRKVVQFLTARLKVSAREKRGGFLKRFCFLATRLKGKRASKRSS
jgi:hypothetical protein